MQFLVTVKRMVSYFIIMFVLGCFFGSWWGENSVRNHVVDMQDFKVKSHDTNDYFGFGHFIDRIVMDGKHNNIRLYGPEGSDKVLWMIKIEVESILNQRDKK